MFRLIGPDGQTYSSKTPGTLGGHRRLKGYGRLDCASALRWIAAGHYLRHRVFFADEATAIAAGYRPCARCLPGRYAAWKADPAGFSARPSSVAWAPTSLDQGVEVGVLDAEVLMGRLHVAADTPFAAKANADGVATIQDAPAGASTLLVWHPDLKARAPFARALPVAGAAQRPPATIELRPAIPR